MVQLVKYGTWYNTNVMHIDGLSTETKPVDKFDGMAIPNGSIYTEIDTGDKYMFDAENKVWYKVSKNYVSLDEHGFVPLENLPPEIYERMYGVADDDARFNLTTDEVQNGDVVFVNDTQIMYLVVDDTKLDSEDGYQEFAAGIAAKAIADEDGRNIKNTYLTEEEYNAGKTLPQGTQVNINGNTYTVKESSEIFNGYTGQNKAVGSHSHAEGSGTTAIGDYSHAEGWGATASGRSSHAEGAGTRAIGESSHAEGAGTTASGSQCHAEGGGATASGVGSHAEGTGTTASGVGSHAEGAGATASGTNSHAEGGGTRASGESSHAEGSFAKAIGDYSHAEGYNTIASSAYQHTEGKFNVEEANDKFAHIIGNGTADNARSNAFAIDWDGKIYTHNSATGFDINSNYLEMQNGIRLYVSDTEPTGTIPEGSLGIGF